MLHVKSTPIYLSGNLSHRHSYTRLLSVFPVMPARDSANISDMKTSKLDHRKNFNTQ